MKKDTKVECIKDIGPKKIGEVFIVVSSYTIVNLEGIDETMLNFKIDEDDPCGYSSNCFKVVTDV